MGRWRWRVWHCLLKGMIEPSRESDDVFDLMDLFSMNLRISSETTAF